MQENETECRRQNTEVRILALKGRDNLAQDNVLGNFSPHKSKNNKKPYMHLPKNTSWLIIITLYIWLFAGISVKAQDFTATTQLNKDTFIVGDKIEILVNADLPQGHIYKLQKIPQLQGLEWLDSAALQKTYNSPGTIFNVIAFDSGTYTFPSLTFSLLDNSNNLIATTNTQELTIHVKYAAVDTTQDIKPIKAPLEVAYSPIPLWVYAVIILVLLVIAYFIYKWWKKKQQKPVEKEEVAPIIPQQNNLSYAEETIEKIHRLKQKESGQNYWFGLKEILREYIAKQYKVRTQEKTSAEMLADLKYKRIEILALERLKNVFSQADLAIFAQQNMDETEKETAAEDAIYFIRQNVGLEKDNS